MKKMIFKISTVLLIVLTISCTGNSTKESSDTLAVPPVADTMPVVHPPNQDSGGVIETPPTNDSMAVMPDSAIKHK